MLSKLYANQKRELSGTPLYAAMFGLTFFSVPWVRRRCYEGFKYVHFFLAGVYVACFFWHAYGNFCVSTLFCSFYSFYDYCYYEHLFSFGICDVLTPNSRITSTPQPQPCFSPTSSASPNAIGICGRCQV